MRKWITLFAFGALALTLALPALAREGHRFKGSDSGPFTVTPISETVVFTEDVATGKANHGIGRYTVVASEFVNLATLEVTGGQFTLTARKGSISGTYSGSAAPTGDPNVVTYHVEGPITGGTGRFAGASGSIVFDGIANFATGQLSDKVSGVLFKSDEDD
jgi:hypothetical protein